MDFSLGQSNSSRKIHQPVIPASTREARASPTFRRHANTLFLRQLDREAPLVSVPVRAQATATQEKVRDKPVFHQFRGNAPKKSLSSVNFIQLLDDTISKLQSNELFSRDSSLVHHHKIKRSPQLHTRAGLRVNEPAGSRQTPKFQQLATNDSHHCIAASREVCDCLVIPKIVEENLSLKEEVDKKSRECEAVKHSLVRMRLKYKLLKKKLQQSSVDGEVSNKLSLTHKLITSQSKAANLSLSKREASAKAATRESQPQRSAAVAFSSDFKLKQELKRDRLPADAVQSLVSRIKSRSAAFLKNMQLAGKQPGDLRHTADSAQPPLLATAWLAERPQAKLSRNKSAKKVHHLDSVETEPARCSKPASAALLMSSHVRKAPDPKTCTAVTPRRYSHRASTRDLFLSGVVAKDTDDGSRALQQPPLRDSNL